MEARLDQVFRDITSAVGVTRLVCLATTANLNNPPFYVGATRRTADTIAANFIFADLAMLPRVIARFDGAVDGFLVDCEHKNAAGELLQRAVELARSTEVRAFKPNDITVESLDSWLAELAVDWSGRRVAVAGVGNVGGKIALCLAERGARVALWRRDRDALRAIAHGLALLKRGTGEFVACDTLTDACRDAELILGCTPGIAVIDESAVTAAANGAIIIDVGNGTIGAEGLRAAQNNGIKVMCLTPNAGWHGFIARRNSARAQLASMRVRRLADGLTLISPGLIGPRGAVLVDDVDRPERIIGVCDGRGDILSPEQAKPFLELLERHDYGK